MRLGLAFLFVTSAAALLGCRGELVIGGEPDGGVNVGDSGGIDLSDASDGSLEVADADGGLLLIHLDGGIGGLCAVDPPGGALDAGDDAGDASDEGQVDASVDASVACACTRRPGAGASSQCPAGLGEYASATLGPSGGALTLEGRQGIASGVAAQITFPPGALSASTEVTLIETAIPPPRDVVDLSPVYLVQPPGLVLASPASLRLPWSNDSGSVSDLSIWFSPDGTCFTRLGDSYTNAGFEQGSTATLGYLIVGTPRGTATARCP
jgi:hypothetical protein